MIFRFRPAQPQQTAGNAAAAELSTSSQPDELARAADAAPVSSNAADASEQLTADSSDSVNLLPPNLPTEDKAAHDLAADSVEEVVGFSPSGALESCDGSCHGCHGFGGPAVNGRVGNIV